MKKRWRPWMVISVLAGTLMACAKTHPPARTFYAGRADRETRAAEQLLREAKASVKRIQGVIETSRQGNPESQFRLGMMILDRAYEYGGEQRAQDVVEALKWFTLSSEQGHHGSQMMLYQLYATEEEFSPDYLLLSDSVLSYALLCGSPRHRGECPQQGAACGQGVWKEDDAEQGAEAQRAAERVNRIETAKLR